MGNRSPTKRRSGHGGRPHRPKGASTFTGQATVVGTIVAAPAGAAPLMDRAVNAAGYQTGGQISPGSWVSIFGSQLADAQVIAAGQPYQTDLGGTRVTLGGTRLPLLFVDPKQLNVFVPFQVTPNTLQQVIVERGSAISIPVNIKIADAIPGIYTMSQSGSGQGAIVISGSGTLAAPAPTGRPARPGRDFGDLCDRPRSGVEPASRRADCIDYQALTDRGSCDRHDWRRSDDGSIRGAHAGICRLVSGQCASAR